MKIGNISSAKAPEKTGAADESKTTTFTEKKTEAPKDGKKKLALALGGLAAAGIAAVGITAAVKKGQVKKLADISFKPVEGGAADGIARLNGKKFTGVIEDVLKDGQGVKLHYVNGKITKSEVSTMIFDGPGTKVVKNYISSIDGNENKTPLVIIRNYKGDALQRSKGIIHKTGEAPQTMFDASCSRLKHKYIKQEKPDLVQISEAEALKNHIKDIVSQTKKFLG